MQYYESPTPSFRDDEEGLWIRNKIDNKAYDEMYSTVPYSPEMEEEFVADCADIESDDVNALIRIYQNVAFREGGPVMWGKPEENFEVLRRIQDVVGGHQTEEMMIVAEEESDRQHLLVRAYQAEQGMRQAEIDYRSRMGDIASRLADALVGDNDEARAAAATEKMLDALRPLDERLRKLESES